MDNNQNTSEKLITTICDNLLLDNNPKNWYDLLKHCNSSQQK